jgi:hypothetical protein
VPTVTMRITHCYAINPSALCQCPVNISTNHQCLCWLPLEKVEFMSDVCQPVPKLRQLPMAAYCI